MTRENLLKQMLADAGQVLHSRFNKVSWREKGRADLVTEADLASQELILSQIKKHFPGDDYLLEEEGGTKLTGSQYLWIADPLDGTNNFAHGYPHSAVSIGLLKNNEPYLGGILDPFRKEMFFASKGGGAFLNGLPIKVTGAEKLSSSLLVTGFAYDRAQRGEFYCGFVSDFLAIAHDIRRSGSAALDLAWIAAGRLDGYWEFSLKPWDITAGVLLVSEAGGAVTDFSGNKLCDTSKAGKEILATNSLIHEEMLEIIKKRLSKPS